MSRERMNKAGRLTDAAAGFGALIFAIAYLTSCGGSADRTEAEPSESPPSSTPTVPANRAGRVDTQSGGSINYTCSGTGEPAILLEAGSDSAGTEQYSSLLINQMAERTTVCTYDRPGTGLSLEVPDHRRTLDDICAVQDEVIEALGIATPYILFGQSAGGNMVIGCAERHPDRLAGLVIVEGYHDDPRMMREFQREEGFTWQSNGEHLDYIHLTDELDALEMPVGDFPVVVISATDADPGNVQNQAYWLLLSPDSRQVTLEGSHDLHDDNPQLLAAETLKLLDG